MSDIDSVKRISGRLMGIHVRLILGCLAFIGVLLTIEVGLATYYTLVDGTFGRWSSSNSWEFAVLAGWWTMTILLLLAAWPMREDDRPSISDN